jgi:hypothetical protein
MLCTGRRNLIGNVYLLPCRKLQCILRCGQGQIYIHIYMYALRFAHMDVPVIFTRMYDIYTCDTRTFTHVSVHAYMCVRVSCMHACINACMQA